MWAGGGSPHTLIVDQLPHEGLSFPLERLSGPRQVVLEVFCVARHHGEPMHQGDDVSMPGRHTNSSPRRISRPPLAAAPEGSPGARPRRRCRTGVTWRSIRWQRRRLTPPHQRPPLLPTPPPLPIPSGSPMLAGSPNRPSRMPMVMAISISSSASTSATPSSSGTLPAKVPVCLLRQPLHQSLREASS